jgi:hypothetical protein
MDFNGPEPADLAEVRSLNVAFLDYLAGPEGQPLRQELPTSLRPVVAALSERQVQRLAEVPFLLLTLSESDDACWGRLLQASPVRDLFAVAKSDDDPLSQIAAAALGFLWQLARKNAYATRLVSGASLNWCEQLASCTLLGVLRCAAEHQGLVGPRLAAHKVFWTRLLGAGLSSEDAVRRAAHLSALQTVLTPAMETRRRRFRTAACYTSVPAMEARSDPAVRDDD